MSEEGKKEVDLLQLANTKRFEGALGHAQVLAAIDIAESLRKLVKGQEKLIQLQEKAQTDTAAEKAEARSLALKLMTTMPLPTELSALPACEECGREFDVAIGALVHAESCPQRTHVTEEEIAALEKTL